MFFLPLPWAKYLKFGILSPACVILLLAAGCFAQRAVQDELGRKTVVPSNPHRVISLAPSITDTLYAMGLGADVIGVSNYTKYPEEAAHKPSVGEPLSPSIETIVALHPDLVLAIEDMNRAETVDNLEKLGIPVFVIHPKRIAGIYASITNLGNVLNHPENATALLSRLQKREQVVREQAKGRNAPRIFFVLYPDPVMTIGKNAFITELIETAGGKSITDDLAQDWPQISLEAVVARRPQFLMIASGSHITIDDLKKKSGWSTLEAVRTSRVFYTDDKILHPSPAAFDALEDLAKQFHSLGASQ